MVPFLRDGSIAARHHHEPIGTIVLRPNEFTQPDYSVIYKDPDGRELDVGRIYSDITGTVGGASPWFWTVTHHQRRGRAEPHQGRCDSLDEAKAAWRKCWDSADTPIHWPCLIAAEGLDG